MDVRERLRAAVRRTAAEYCRAYHAGVGDVRLDQQARDYQRAFKALDDFDRGVRCEV